MKKIIRFFILALLSLVFVSSVSAKTTPAPAYYKNEAEMIVKSGRDLNAFLNYNKEKKNVKSWQLVNKNFAEMLAAVYKETAKASEADKQAYARAAMNFMVYGTKSFAPYMKMGVDDNDKLITGRAATDEEKLLFRFSSLFEVANARDHRFPVAASDWQTFLSEMVFEIEHTKMPLASTKIYTYEGIPMPFPLSTTQATDLKNGKKITISHPTRNEVSYFIELLKKAKWNIVLQDKSYDGGSESIDYSSPVSGGPQLHAFFEWNGLYGYNSKIELMLKK